MSKNEQKTVTALYRKYMGPSGNGISDAGLRKLAGWMSFVAGWEAAKKCFCIDFDNPCKTNA